MRSSGALFRGSFWRSLVVLAAIAIAAPSAQAQVFRPRTAKAITSRTVAAPAAPGAIAGKKPAPAAAAPGKPAVKTNPARRTVAKKKRGRPRPNDDTVVIEDEEEEEDVKITDD